MVSSAKVRLTMQCGKYAVTPQGSLRYGAKLGEMPTRPKGPRQGQVVCHPVGVSPILQRQRDAYAPKGPPTGYHVLVGS